MLQIDNIIPTRTGFASPVGRPPVFSPQTSETAAAVTRVVIAGGALHGLSMRSGPLRTADKDRRSLSEKTHFEDTHHPGSFQGSYHLGRSGLQQAVDEKQEDDQDVVDSPARKRTKTKRNDRIPENLPRIEITLDVPDSDKTCDTHGSKTLIGYDTTETLVFTPSKLEVEVTKLPKYACPNQPDCGVAQAERPQGLIEGNRYDTSIAAEIITAKYGYHQPFYRQQDRPRRMIRRMHG